MGRKGKFEKIERNETYYAAYGEEEQEQEKEKKSKSKKEKAKEILAIDPERVPEKIEPSTKFTYKREKRKIEHEEEKTALTESPSKAPLLFVLIVMCLVLVTNILSVNGVFTNLSDGFKTALPFVIYAVVYVVPAVVYMIVFRARIGRHNINGFSPSKLPFIFSSFGLVLCLTALQKYAISYIFSYSGSASGQDSGILMAIVVGALLPAICEELVVRGIFQYEVSSYAGGLCGIIVSAFVFGMLHFDFRFFFVYFVAGLVLGMLTHVTRSVFPAMIVHFLNNTVSILFSDKLSFVAAERIGGTLLMIVLAVLCFVFLIVTLQMAEGISERKAASYINKDKEIQTTPKLKKNIKEFILISPKGHTFARSFKIIGSPIFLISVAVFIAASVALLELS